MNLYNLDDSAYIAMYLVVFVTTCLGGDWVRRYLSKYSVATEQPNEPLDQYDIAMLAGGPENAFFTAVASLAHRGAINLAAGKFAISKAASIENLHPFEALVMSKLSDEPKLVRVVFRDLSGVFNTMQNKLVSYGLLVSTKRMTLVRLVPVLIVMVPVLFLALPKISLELAERQSPLCLFVFVGVSLFVAARFSFQGTRPTDAGKLVVDNARKNNVNLSKDYAISPQNLSAKDLALAAALYGGDAVYTDPFARARLAYHGGVYSD